MRQNDLLKSDNGDHLRVLLYGDQQSYVVNCQRCKMPFPISTPSLLQMEKMPQDMYRLLALDEDISDRRAELIAPLLAEECICDKSYRNRVLREIVSGNSVSRKTVLQYLWLYWVYQSKNALLPAEKSNTEKRPLSSDEKTIRWALNKFYYTPQKQSLQTAYKMMLHAKYCDAKGKLKPDYPSFWQFRYYFRQHRDPISESISREGIKAYQRNHRPFIGAVSDYAGTIGTYMTDATVADIYIVSRLSRRPIGRPVIYTMVDAYSRLITGVYVGLEGGQYALRLLLQNTFADKVSFCRQHNIEIDPQDWPSHHLPTKIMTDRGSEFLGGPLENLCSTRFTHIIPASFPLLIFFMILCDIIAVDLMFATSKSVKQVVEAESKVKINEISKTQYLRLAEKSDTIRTWKHDTREAMNGALLLMQQGRTAEAELLLKDRLASMQVETIAIKSGNIIVDAILTQKIDECLDNGIVLDMKVEIPSHIMREEDTCEVFGSILDFAVAVSNKQPTDKKIKIVLQDQDNKLKVFVTANAAVFDSVDATRMTEIEQSTTKILSAYNGIVSAQHDEDQSTITWNLLIPLPQDNEWLASYIYDSSEALSSGVRTVKQ